jgi:phosphoglycerate dehydrogenase-like enzyme
MPESTHQPLRACGTVRQWAGRDLPTSRELTTALAGVEGLVCDNRLQLPGDVLDAATELRTISLIGAAYSSVDMVAAERQKIVVMNTPGVMAAAVADLTIALLICLARNIIQEVTRVRAGGWSRVEAAQLGHGLDHMRLGIVGLGACGRAVATRAEAFGSEIAYCDPHVVDTSYRRLDLNDLLRWADAISLHADLNQSSSGLIGARELRLMKPGGYLLNLARGGLVDELALADAIREGHLAGAALDVLTSEPPAADEPLLHLPNVLIVPHIGAATTSARDKMLRLAVENAVAATEGRPMNVVGHQGE